MKTHWQDVSIPISRNSPAKVLHSQPGIIQVFLEMAMFFSQHPFFFEPQQRAHSPQVLPDDSASRAAGSFIMGCNYRRVMIRKEHEWKLEGR